MPKSYILFSVLIFTFITRLLLLLCFPLQYTDYYLINTAAENLINGHGMGFMKAALTDNAQFHFEGLRLWPPLVTFSTAIFIKLTGSIRAADTLIMILILLILIRYLLKLFNQLNLTEQNKILAFLILATNPDIIKQPGYSDIAAATACVVACSYSYQLLVNNSKFSLAKTILLSLLFFLPSAFRYQYYPLTIFLPASLIIGGHFLQFNTLKKRGWIITTLTITWLIAQETFLYFYTAQPISQSVAMDERGFYLYNLTQIYPTLIKTFLNFSYIENKLLLGQILLQPILSILFATAFLLWAIILLRKLYKSIFTTDKSLKEKQNYYAVLVLTLVTILPPAILTVLSLVHNSRSGEAGGWTYVVEGRYYITTSLLTLLLSVWYFQNYLNHIKPYFRQCARLLFYAILLYNSILTIKFYYNVATNNIPDKEITNRNDRKIIEAALLKYSSKTIPTIISSNEPYFAYFRKIDNVAISSKPDALIRTGIKTSKPIKLFLVAQNPVSKTEQILIEKTKAKKIIELTTSTIFIADIYPNITVVN